MLATMIGWAVESWDLDAVPKAMPLLRHVALATQCSNLLAWFDKIGGRARNGSDDIAEGLRKAAIEAARARSLLA